MEFKNIKSRMNAAGAALLGRSSGTPTNAASPLTKSDLYIINKIVEEFKDRSRKQIKQWRDSMTLSENIDDPRWYLLQDLYDDTIDAHLASVIDTRKMTTTNHRFYVVDKKSGEQLEEQTQFLDKKWFFDFLDHTLDAIFKKYSVIQILKGTEDPEISFIPRRNVCPQSKRIYLEVSNDRFIDYSLETDVIEINHNSPFGILNDVMPNCIWKKNAMQAWAEFGEKFGMPLISATTPNVKDIPRIELMLKKMGEAAQAVLPHGTTIEVHDMANAGNPKAVYESQGNFHDNQISKRVLGGTMVSDNGSSRSQSEVHERTLDEKISVADQRFARFVVNDKLFPILQSLGFPFDNTKMKFQFDETEELDLTEHWKIVSDAVDKFEWDDKGLEWIAKTFNLPKLGRKAVIPPVPTKANAKASFNSATLIRAMGVACGVALPEYPVQNHPMAAGSNKSLMDDLDVFDEQIASFLYNDNTTEAERMRLLKGKRVSEDLRSGLFSGWGNRRMEVDWNAPDNRALSMMEMNLFHFSESKGRAEVLLLNRLLIDKETNQIRSEADFISQAKQINSTFNETYLSTERDFTIATGQNSARYLEFLAEKNQIPNWKYQTVGDSHVRDSHRVLDGRVFSFDDLAARRLIPPNGYKCRCEELQFPGKPGDMLMSGKDALPILFPNAKQMEMFGINRAEAGVVFRENQMYLGTLKDAQGNKSVGKPINDYIFTDYGLPKWKDFSGTLKPMKLDATITSNNVGELFKNNAGTKDFKAMGWEDYLKRKLIMKEKTFNDHLTPKYLTDQENRPQLFAHLSEMFKSPDEVWMNTFGKGDLVQDQFRYIKFYKDKVAIADCMITNDGLEVKTWYELKDLEEAKRVGLWVK